MTHWIKSASPLVLACATIFVVSSAWADKPMDYTIGPVHFGPFPSFDCTQFEGMDFWVWAEGDTMEFGKIFYDKDGALTKAIGTSYTDNAVLWAPADPGCNEAPFAACVDPRPVMPGTNTHTADDNLGRPEHQTVIYKEWIYVNGDWFPTWIKNSALRLHIGIPGYGNVITNAGTVVLQFNFDTLVFDVVKMTPNWNNPRTEDIFAVCSYIGNR